MPANPLKAHNKILIVNIISIFLLITLASTTLAFENLLDMQTVSRTDNLIIYPEPVAFNCTVNKKRLVAEILGECDNPINYTFRIKFSDGVTMTATALESGKWWLEDGHQMEYISSISNELHDFISVKHWSWHKFEVDYNQTKLLVWTCKLKSEEEREKFSVYYSGGYQFDLRKTKNSWEAKCMRVVNPRAIDEKLAGIITNWLDILE